MSDEVVKGFVQRAIDDLCVWKDSKSIVSGNTMYENCRQKCDGFNKKCLVYLSRTSYFRQLSTKYSGEKRE